MEAAKTDMTYEMTQSSEMSKLYRALAIAQANIVLYLRAATDEEDLKRRAKEITENLETLTNAKADTRGDKCAHGTVWNPITQQCE